MARVRLTLGLGVVSVIVLGKPKKRTLEHDAGASRP
jgi:hypothetical protein